MSNRPFLILSRLAGLMRRTEPAAGHYHDLSAPLRHHFAMRLKRPFRKCLRRERDKDVSAFERDSRERLAQFLREFGRRTFGSSGTLESLALLEDTTDSNERGGRYLAAFASGTKMIWTVALDDEGGVSFDGINAPA